MSKRNVEKGSRTRRRLLDAAAAELARAGPNGTSLTAVAARAGMKGGSVYFHFESREVLFLAVLEEGLRESVERLDQALAACEAPAERLRAAIRAHTDLLADLSDYATVALTMADEFDHDSARDFRMLRSHYAALWVSVVNDAVEVNVLPTVDSAELTAELILGALNAVRHRAVASRDAVVQSLEQLLGLRPPAVSAAKTRRRVRQPTVGANS